MDEKIARWRKYAEECRKLASMMTSPATRRIMLNTASSWEEMILKENAKETERKTNDEKPANLS